MNIHGDPRLPDDFDAFDKSMRGTWVIVRCYGNDARRVRIWAEDEDAVWILNDEQYRRRSSDLLSLYPVGFRRHAVYQDAPDLFNTTEEYNDAFWSQLTLYLSANGDEET